MDSFLKAVLSTTWDNILPLLHANPLLLYSYSAERVVTAVVLYCWPHFCCHIFCTVHLVHVQETTERCDHKLCPLNSHHSNRQSSQKEKWGPLFPLIKTLHFTTERCDHKLCPLNSHHSNRQSSQKEKWGPLFPLIKTLHFALRLLNPPQSGGRAFVASPQDRVE